MNKDQNVTYLHLDDIIPNRFQPREVFDERALKELAVSIKEHGVIQPIIVREINNNKYEIIAGERRYKASALAGMTTIPAIIRNLDDKEAAKVALLENLQRKNLNPIEEARTYQKIIELDQMTQDELAKTMGKSQSAVANKLRLLTLPEEIQKALLKEQISERHARSLLNISDPDEQTEMLKRIVKERMSVRKLEEEIKNRKENREDKIKDEKDLNSLINPTPVKLEDNTINEEKQDSPSFLMSPPPTKSEDIINYGEVKNEDEDTDDEEGGFESDTVSTNPVDIESLKNNAADIGNILETSAKESSLADLLNLNKNEATEATPAEEALRDSEDKKENKEDYFKVPDLMNVNLPNTDENKTVGNFYNQEELKPKKNYDSLIDFTNNKEKTNEEANLETLNEALGITNNEAKKENSKSLGAALMGEAYSKKELKDEKYNIKEMVGKIRETLKELELSGAKIDTDEMNFENQYQILIKIDKGQ